MSHLEIVHSYDLAEKDVWTQFSINNIPENTLPGPGVGEFLVSTEMERCLFYMFDWACCVS